MGCGVGFSIRELYWNRFFGGEKKNIDIFELIDAAIRVAPIERQREFLCRRMDIIHFLLQDHSTGKENNPRKVLNQGDDTIVSPCPDDHQFVNGPNKKRKTDDDHYFNVKAEKKIRRSIEQQNQKKWVNSDDDLSIGKENNPIKVVNQDDDVSDFANQLERKLLDAPNKKTKASNDEYHSNVNKEEKKFRRSFEEQQNYMGKKGVESDRYENKFEVSKTRFVERNQQIQRSKRRVQVLEVAPNLGYCNGKHVFRSRIEKPKILGNNCWRLQQEVF